MDRPVYDSIELILLPTEPVRQNPMLYAKFNFGACIALPLVHPSNSLVNLVSPCCGARQQSGSFRCRECRNDTTDAVRAQWPDAIMANPSAFTQPLLAAYGFNPLDAVIYGAMLNEDLTYILERRGNAWRELLDSAAPTATIPDPLASEAKKQERLLALNRTYKGERITFRESTFLEVFPSTVHYRGLRP